MILLPVSAGGPGGVLEMEYANALAGERHALRLHLAPFDAAPLDPDHDRIYTGFGPEAPLESGVLMTFGAIGALWQQYYGPGWTLSLIDLWENQNGVMVRLGTPPLAAPLVGVSTDAAPGGVVLKRVFHLRSTPSGDRRLFLSQVPGGQEGVRYSVSPTSGGIDARDQALMAYLSSPDSGVRSFCGKRFAPDAVVQAMWARRLAPLAGGTDAAGRDTFYGPVPPDDAQDGWLWVDTSSGLGQPWPLRVFDAAASAWELTGQQDQYFQDVEPAAPQNGDLWVIAGGSAPYRMLVWNAGDGLWQDVGAAGGGSGGPYFSGACLVFPNGAVICNPADGTISAQVDSAGHQHLLQADRHRWPSGHDIQVKPPVVGYAAPNTAPHLDYNYSGAGFPSALPAGLYGFAITYLTPLGETGLSPTGSIGLPLAGGTITIRSAFSWPPGVLGVRAYLMSYMPPEVIGG